MTRGAGGFGGMGGAELSGRDGRAGRGAGIGRDRKGAAWLAGLVMLGWASVASSFGQGAVFFSNKVAGVVDAPFQLRCSNRTYGLGENPRMKVELAMVGPGRSITPISPAVEFRHTPQAATGYFDGGVVTIPGNQGSPITVLLRYYTHTQYDGSAYYGESHPFVVTPTLPPDVPADLEGLGKQPIYMDQLLSACPRLGIEVAGEIAILEYYWLGAIPEPFPIPETYEGRPVAAIGPSAFWRYSLPSLTITESIRTIHALAFVYSEVTNVFIPSGVTNIEAEAFSQCNKLSVIEVAPGNRHYASEQGVLFNKDRDRLLQFPGGRSGPYVVPGGVTRIEEAAFGYCFRLTSVSIPGSVTNLGSAAFNSCGGLEDLTLGSGLQTIGERTFIYCRKLRSLTIPESVRSVGANSFQDCSELSAVLFMGDAPPDLGNQFLGTPATVYYLPGAKGWGATFGGVPTAVWDLRAEEVGFDDEGFGFGIRGAVGLPVVIEAAGSLGAAAWEAVGTNVLSEAGLGVFREAAAVEWPMRFYRFRFP